MGSHICIKSIYCLTCRELKSCVISKVLWKGKELLLLVSIMNLKNAKEIELKQGVIRRVTQVSQTLRTPGVRCEKRHLVCLPTWGCYCPQLYWSEFWPTLEECSGTLWRKGRAKWHLLPMHHLRFRKGMLVLSYSVLTIQAQLNHHWTNCTVIVFPV